ncbi:ribonuclease H-like domain-containing protein [Tanacetum coccineum]
MSLHGYSNGEYDAGGDDDNVTLISTLDVSHPLHLHPNDYVALTVVSVKLKGTDDYQVWSCAMLLALEGKNKTEFIDGSCRRSNTDEVLGRQWDRVNVVVLGWILNSIYEELFLGQIFSERAKHVWDELKETYDKVDGFVTFSLHHKIHTVSQNGSSITDYYHKLNALWKQFDALIELPRCTCHATNDFKKHNQLMKLMQFLMGLDDNYMQIRSSILSRETLPDVRSAYMSQTSTSFSRPSNDNRHNDNRFSDEQTATLISLIKENFVNRKGVHSNMAGANQHITYTDKNLIDVIDIFYSKIKVTHPNGTEAFITKIENMPLTDYLTLYDVLVVPEYCDLRKGKILETSKQIGGLYYFDGNQDLIILLAKAKQTREHFPLSDHVSTELGELVHLDFYSPQQNGIVERKHRQLFNVARSLLFQGDIALNMWSECVLTATYLINRLPTSLLNGKSPYDLVYNKPPSLKHLRSFGCLAYATILNSHDKFGSRSEKNVKFFKDIFPFKLLNSTRIDISIQDVNHLNFLNTNTLDDLPATPKDEERRNPSPIRHGNLPSYSCSTSAFLNENDAGHFQDTNVSASENGSFASNEDNINSSEGNDLYDHTQKDVSQVNTNVQNLRSFRTFVFPRNFNDFIVDSKVIYGLEKYVNYSHLS